MLPFPILVGLVLAFNLLWIVVYVIMIPLANRDQAYAVPVVALGINTAWDVYGTLIHPSPGPQWMVNIPFLAADLVLLIHVIRFWASDSLGMKRGQFYLFTAVAMTLSLILYLALTFDLRDFDGVIMAFVDNAFNSALFLSMFFRRPDLRGQSLYIGVLKLIGTGCASVAFTFNRWPGTETSILLPTLCLTILFFDACYCVLVWQRARELGISPWRHGWTRHPAEPARPAEPGEAPRAAAVSR